MSSPVVLKHLSGSRAGAVEAFDAPNVLIGRGPHNDVALDTFLDPTVSANHAEIRREHEGFVIYDMGSLNGTYVNGRHVRRAAIRPGDEIGLGLQGPRLAFASTGEVQLHAAAPRAPRGQLLRTAEERVAPGAGAAAAEAVIGDPAAQKLTRLVIGLVIVLIGLLVRLCLR